MHRAHWDAIWQCYAVCSLYENWGYYYYYSQIPFPTKSRNCQLDHAEKVVRLSQGCESICEKKSSIIWNEKKDVLFDGFKLHWSLNMGFCEEQKKKVWNQIKIWTLTSLLIMSLFSVLVYIFTSLLKSSQPHSCYSYHGVDTNTPLSPKPYPQRRLPSTPPSYHQSSPPRLPRPHRQTQIRPRLRSYQSPYLQIPIPLLLQTVCRAPLRSLPRARLRSLPCAPPLLSPDSCFRLKRSAISTNSSGTSCERKKKNIIHITVTDFNAKFCIDMYIQIHKGGLLQIHGLYLDHELKYVWLKP